MAGTKGSESVRSLMYPGKSALLPPKIPFPSVSASYSEYVPCGSSRHSGHKVSSSIEKPHHQRTSSESHLVEELPFWLDDLLNEPDTPASRKSGHRRSASDSYAYLDVANNAATNPSLADLGYRRNMGGRSTPDTADTDFLKQRNPQRDALVSSGARPCWSVGGGGKHMGAASYVSQDATADYADALSLDTKRFSCKENNSIPQPVTYDADNNTKRAKQQFAQRSRVRKLQYISELERNVQTLQKAPKFQQSLIFSISAILS
ncbi:hypothetical protein HA466_0104260 [Hirschfeldia incana]|nr:hypothetical protein HA466_0104260 [Hirschfeldia incana]